MLHKFHKRQVVSLAGGFTSLAADNEILVSEQGNILSFQSHPELTGEISQGLLDSDDGFYTEHAGVNPGIILKDRYNAHDGEVVWKKIIDWVVKS